MLILEILLATSFLLWLGLAILLTWNALGVTVLRPGPEGETVADAPKVSIIVPARNEEEVLDAALESFCQLNYPDYEVIVIDDASADATGRIADEWTARPSARGRISVIHNRELPAGWTGKVHALNLAAHAASGGWILATDADVVFHPAILSLAMGVANRERAQLLSLTPELELGGFWERVALPAFTLLLSTLYPLRLVNRPNFPRAIAAGAFILMRRSDFDALGGYEPVKNVVIEDVRMAEHFKRNGRRVFVAVSRGLYRTRMYSGLGELWEGLSRSAFEGTGCSVVKILGVIFTGLLTSVLPWLVAGIILLRNARLGQFLHCTPLLALAIATCAESLLIYIPLLVFLRVPVLYAFTLPLAAVFYSGVGLNSMFKSVFGSGVAWKGRRYRPPA